MRISEKKLYRFVPESEGRIYFRNENIGPFVFASRKVPGMPRQRMPKQLVYIYAAERFDGIASTHWMRGRLLGMARIGSIQEVEGS